MYNVRELILTVDQSIANSFHQIHTNVITSLSIYICKHIIGITFYTHSRKTNLHMILLHDCVIIVLSSLQMSRGMHLFHVTERLENYARFILMECECSIIRNPQIVTRCIGGTDSHHNQTNLAMYIHVYYATRCSTCNTIHTHSHMHLS